MNILYITQYFKMPVENVGARNFEFAKRWVQHGHCVNIVTSTAHLNNYTLRKVSASGRIIKRFRVGAVKISAVNVAYSQEMGYLRRCLAFAFFALLSAGVVILSRKCDLVYASSTPLTVGFPALVGKWLRRIPYVFEVRDQWPKIPIEMGIISNKWLVQLLLFVERTIYKNSLGVVALSPGMAYGVHCVSPRTPVQIAPNCADTNVFSPKLNGDGIRNKYGLEKKFVLLHAGSMGRVNSLGFVVDAAERLRGHSDVHFVLIGNGNERGMLQGRIHRIGLQNVTILDPVPRSEVRFFYAAANVALVIVCNVPVIENNSANKFFDALSAGVPVLLNYGGWQREVLEKHRAGFGCAQYDLEEFCQRVLYLKGHPEEVLKMGKNARRLAVERFDRDLLANQVLWFLTQRSYQNAKKEKDRNCEVVCKSPFSECR